MEPNQKSPSDTPPVECELVKLRGDLLDRRIDAVKDAINRSRATWLFATLVTFVIATAIFNAMFSWNATQIDNRAEIVREVSASAKQVRSEAAVVGSTLSNEMVEELAYLKKLVPQTDDEKDPALVALRKAADEELRAHVLRRVAFDTVQIPLIGLSVAGTDIGIVGGLALIVVGYWLLVSIRTESHAFGEFIRRSGESTFVSGGTPYSIAENEYAFSAVRHYMIFGVSTPNATVNLVTFASFFIPPALMMLNHGATAVMLLGDPSARYWQPHVVIELAVTCVVAAVWVRALIYQLETVHALQAWRSKVERRSNESEIIFPMSLEHRILVLIVYRPLDLIT